MSGPCWRVTASGAAYCGSVERASCKRTAESAASTIEKIRRRIRQLAANDTSRRRERVRLGLVRPHDVDDLEPASLQVVRNQAAMALPPQGLRAHDGRRRRSREV